MTHPPHPPPALAPGGIGHQVPAWGWGWSQPRGGAPDGKPRGKVDGLEVDRGGRLTGLADGYELAGLLWRGSPASVLTALFLQGAGAGSEGAFLWCLSQTSLCSVYLSLPCFFPSACFPSKATWERRLKEAGHFNCFCSTQSQGQHEDVSPSHLQTLSGRIFTVVYPLGRSFFGGFSDFRLQSIFSVGPHRNRMRWRLPAPSHRPEPRGLARSGFVQGLVVSVRRGCVSPHPDSEIPQ